MFKTKTWLFRTAGRAKHLEPTSAARRQNACVSPASGLPEGAGRCGLRASARRGRTVMASLDIALVRCRRLFCRAFPGHAARSAPQASRLTRSLRYCSAADPKASTRGAAMATVFTTSRRESFTFWRAELQAVNVQEKSWLFRTAGRAKHLEPTAARRQNAYSAASFRDKQSAAPLSSLRNTNSKRQRTNDLSQRIKTLHPLTLRAAME